MYLTDNVDEFALQILASYRDKTFTNISTENLNLDTDEEKHQLETINEESKEMLETMKAVLGENVTAVRFTNRLKSHPVCLISEGVLSLEMEKILKQMPNATDAKAEIVMEINKDHPIANKLKELAESDSEKLEKLDKAMDSIKKRFGDGAIVRGSSLMKDKLPPSAQEE